MTGSIVNEQTGYLKNSGKIYCTKCGQENTENTIKCTRCGQMLHDTQYVVDKGIMGGLIPRNALALWAYYLGVFALIPCIGLPLGVVALALGIKGLRYADQHPDAGGKGHAIVGIVLGGLISAVYAMAAIGVIISAILN